MKLNLKIPEEFLHFLWKNKLYYNENLETSLGEKIKIINPGLKNNDAGPDFFNAKIKINNTTWAGNVEIHINSSDWEKHNHNKNKDYDSVILQVVLNNDKPIYRSNNEIIPTVEIKYNNKYFENYNALLENQLWIACEKNLPFVEEFIFTHWLTNLTAERLERKSTEIIKKLNSNNNHWEETFYQQLARSFGSKTNAEPFEWLAKSLPVKILAKHKDNIHQIEALLYGQAGFLNEPMGHEYYLNIKKEYEYLQKRHGLKPLQKHIWKFLRLRPLNFPTVRIAQFAQLIYKSSRLFSKIIESKSIEELYNLFNVSTSLYWKNHYNFNKTSKTSEKKPGKAFINGILINTVIPFYFVYGIKKDNQYYKNKALKFLEHLPPESNSIISKWKELGIKVENAYISQALLQLKNEYCNRKKCLNCQIGNKIIIQ